MSSAISRCTICLDPVDHPIARLNPCLHGFCLSCVKGWILEKFSCPNCTVKCTSVVRVEKEGETELKLEDLASLSIGEPTETTGKKEKGKLMTSALTIASASKEETFDCIDHTFIIAEVRKLSARVSQLQKRLSSYAGRTSKNRQDYTNCLDNIHQTLSDLKYDMEEFAEFEPQDMMMMLYEIDADLKVVDKYGDPNQLYYGYQEEEECEDFEISYEPNQTLFDKIEFKQVKTTSKKK